LEYYNCIIPDCPNGYYFDPISVTCVPCISPCSTCLDATRCTYCVSGYNYLDDNSWTCINNTLSCPSGYFKDSTYPICRNCSVGCLNCTSLTNCTNCLTDLNYYLSNGTCNYMECIDYYFYNVTSNECESCPSYCIECTQAGECTLCEAGYFLIESNWTCDLTCPAGYYASTESGTCMVC